MHAEHDLVVIGAGPAGLSFALSLAMAGLRVLILEKESEVSLASPAFDGREIALTHHSVDILKKLGAWVRIPADEISLLRSARVMNGADAGFLGFKPDEKDRDGLGYLVPNHLIRQALYEQVKAHAHITLKAEQQVSAIRPRSEDITLKTSQGLEISTPLAVASDSRFSETRRMMGIAADMHDFGKTMMVCRMTHETPHDHVAYEWFDYEQTAALLPCNGNVSSVVLTLPANQIAELMTQDEESFSRQIESRLKSRWGRMQLAGTRHAYPLVGVYSNRFVAQRFAVIGDAAVGMHPVTAHGFNFGLLSQETLASEISQARVKGQDIGSPNLLARYEQTHRIATKPLYLATLAIVRLFTDDSPPARVLRKAALTVSSHATPLKEAVARQLAGKSGLLPALPPPPGFGLLRRLLIHKSPVRFLHRH